MKPGFLVVSAVALLNVCIAAGALAADKLTIKVGYSPGGGYDSYGRIVAEHIGRFLPGNPETSVENVPGAGSLRLTKMMMGSEPGDGSVIAIVSSSVATTPLLNPELVDFDIGEIRWIGSMANQPSFCAVGEEGPIRTTEDFLTKPLKVGATGPTSATYIFAALVRHLFNPNLEIVVGFSGGTEVNVAIERGELQGRCGNSLASILSSGPFEANNLVGQWATDIPEISRDVPSFLSMVEDGLDFKATRLVIGTLQIDYPFFMPAGTPDDVLATYRAAFDEMVQDESFLSDARERGLLVDPTPGGEIESFLADLTAVDAATIERARELIQ